MAIKCPRCSLFNPPGALRCDCGWDFESGSQRESYLTGTETMTGELAPRIERLAGQFLDGLVALAIYLTVLFLGAPLAETLGPAVAIGIALAYLLLSDALPGGQSLGKRVVKTSVVDATTKTPCTFFKSFLRNLCGLLGLLDWVFIFGPQRQRLGDMAANTIVVRHGATAKPVGTI